MPRGEIQPGGVPEKPFFLSAEGAIVWDAVAPPLIAAGLLTSADSELFGLYCETLAQYDRLLKATLGREVLARGGKWADGEPGEDGKPTRTCIEPPTLVKHPGLAPLAACRDSLIKLSREFGLSPSARAHLAAPQPKGTALDAFIRGVG